MTHSYYIVDVFTGSAFNGAQIAVFPDAGDLTDPQMQTLARELNLSDTVFIHRNGDADYRLKVFSPVSELSFSGHAIIGAAYVLAQSGLQPLDAQHTVIQMRLHSSSTQVVITRRGEGEIFIMFSRKAQPVIDRYVPGTAELAAALGLEENLIISKPYFPMLVSCDQPYLIVPLRSFEAVRQARFHLKAWSDSVAPISATNEILLFSTRSDLRSSNFHGRLVGPQIGIHEDPPIGSVMPAFAGFLGAQGHVRPGTYSFVIDRGTLSTRKSVITVEMVNQKGRENEIRVGGPATIVGKGELQTP